MLRTSLKIGIDANLPLVTDGPDQGSLSPTVADSSVIADTGAGWVRINFVLGPWQDPLDNTKYQARTWAEAYGAIIDGFIQKGLGIYGLVGHEAIKQDPGDRFRLPPEQLSPEAVQSANAWIQQFVTNFVSVVRLFHDRVKVFESFNEPDDWRGSDRNWIHPVWFAKMLQEIYVAVRRDPTLNDVKIISGPLQGLEINHNGAASYLARTYEEGKKRFDWGNGVPFPFDGVGYHIYTLEGFNSNWAEHEAAVKRTYRQYVDAMRDVIRGAEGREKPLYVSEIGWFSNGGIDQWQADNLTLGLGLVAQDTAVALGIWFCTQDFGNDADGKYYGLYRKGALIPANRKPSYFAYKALCAGLAEQETSPFDNQTMINAFFAAGTDLGLGGWELLVRAGLGDLIFARKDPYTGPAVEDLPNLTDDEKEAIRRRLGELVPELRRKLGWTTSHCNFREGPGTSFAVIQVLPPETQVEVLGEEGDWFHVVALGKTGYVHRSLIMLEEDLAPSGFLRLRPELQDVPLDPPQSERIEITPQMDWTTGVLVKTWNRSGGLLAVLANELKLDPAVAVAVFVVEAPRGQGFADDGRMIIRFESQIFYDRWGKSHPDQFAAHFQFDSAKRWQGHRWRLSVDQPWQSFHDTQDGEWQVFTFARTLDDTAAKQSISMGAPQIMGFNFASIGYESVDAMYQAFSTSERAQVIGFFDFVKGSESSSPRLKALRELDFAAFAALYNGSGQVTLYNDLLTQRYEAFRRLRAGEAVPSAAPMAAPGAPAAPVPSGDMAPAADLQHEAVPLVSSVKPEWQERAEKAEAVMQRSFARTAEMMTALTRANLRLYWTLLGMAIVSLLVAIIVALSGGELGYVAFFAGVTGLAVLAHLLINPMARLERELELVSQLQMINNTYWSRMSSLQPGPGVEEEMRRIHQEASEAMDAVISRGK